MIRYPVAMDGRQVAIYRSVLPHLVQDNMDKTGQVVRPPVNVPTVVDNLWEWKRPAGYPSRRMSAFASPTPELARSGRPQHAKVYQVDIRDGIIVAQLRGYSDSRDHPETVTLPILLYERLDSSWISAPMDEKDSAGRLWLPCLSQQEVAWLFAEVTELRPLRDEVESSIHYWSDVDLIDPADPKLDPEGEIFFEAPDGYQLRPVD